MADSSQFDSFQAAPEPASPVLHAVGERLGQLEQLDEPGEKLATAVKQALPAGPVKDLLSGTWLGHALHPLLTDVPIGTWTSAMLLDLIGGEDAEVGADRLVGIGILASLPAIASGLSDWADTIGSDRRTGLVHAAANSAALTLYTASYAARKSGRRRLGVSLGLVAGGALGLGGWIGGHLSYGLGVGVDATTFDYPATEWTPVLAESDLGEGEPRQVDLGGVAALVTKIDGRISAISNSCTHRGGQLDQGEVANGCITCPIHQSVFSLEDGSVVRGPATAPQPTYDVRVRGGQVELRG